MTREPEHASRRSVVDELVADLGPVRPVRFARLFGLCVFLEIVAIVVAATVFGMRHDLAAQLHDPWFLAAIASLGVGAAWCSAIAIRLALPGRAVDARVPWLLLLPVVLAGVVLVLRPVAGSSVDWQNMLFECASCAGITAASALVPWLVSLLVLRRLAPLNALRIGVFAGLSAFLVGALVTELHCPNPSSVHVALAHFLPVTLLTMATCAVAAAFLRIRQQRG